MDFRQDFQGNYVLPSWVAKGVAFFVFVIALYLIYYGIYAGVLNQDIAVKGRFSGVSTIEGHFAIIFGIVFFGLGIVLIRIAYLILKSSRKNNKDIH